MTRAFDDHASEVRNWSNIITLGDRRISEPNTEQMHLLLHPARPHRTITEVDGRPIVPL